VSVRELGVDATSVSVHCPMRFSIIFVHSCLALPIPLSLFPYLVVTSLPFSLVLILVHLFVLLYAGTCLKVIVSIVLVCYLLVLTSPSSSLTPALLCLDLSLACPTLTPLISSLHLYHCYVFMMLLS
jgi:hypothetical protein